MGKTVDLSTYYYNKAEIDAFLEDKADSDDIPIPSNTKPSADTSSGNKGTSTEYARADHIHPKSSIYATSGHNHSSLSNITSIMTPPNVSFLTAKTAVINLFDNFLKYERSNTKIQYKKNNTFSELATMNDIEETSVETIVLNKYWIYNGEEDEGFITFELINNETGFDETITYSMFINGTYEYICDEENWQNINLMINNNVLGVLSSPGLYPIKHYSASTKTLTFDIYDDNQYNALYNDLGYVYDELTSDYIQKSQTTGLVKNDGTIDTNTYLTQHQNLPTIADNLTTNDATQVLSAKQGKILNDLIGDAITYINQ